MGDVLELLNQSLKQLLGRASGPLYFRFIMMPTVITVLAIRAGIRDQKTGRVQFLWLTRPDERLPLFRSILKDIGRIMIVAVVLDTTYQIIALKSFHPGQLLIVVAFSTIVPYVLIRAPAAALAKMIWKRAHRDAPAGGRAVGGSGR